MGAQAIGGTRRADAARLPLPALDPLAAPADPGLIRLVGAGRCLRLGVLPWRRVGGATVVLAPHPDHLLPLAAILGPLRHAVADAATVRAGLRLAAGALLVEEAETRVPDRDSCRNLGHGGRTGGLAAGLWLAGLLALAAPLLAAGAVLAWATLSLLLTTGLRLAALCASRPRAIPLPGPDDPAPARLPVITLLVPLFREREIAGHLLRRLDALDYPRDRLDLCLIVEEEDAVTRATLAAAALPAHAQVVVVPPGTVRTKPRAMNFALDFTHGSIIGIYDAEDRPDPDQLQRVVRHFARAGPDVACLQGALDYYNHRSNWLARCFTLEYAGWFRVILPGLAQMGLVVPLGGTTLFLRRHAIEDVGGWDAHNVTEDADLGIRLARRGYRTEIIATVTAEEANARAWPWIKQRSRWLKGYAVTWLVHSRRPLRLWRELGPWRFLGVQVLFLGTISQFLLAPLLWSFWLVPLGLPHPARALLPPGALLALALLFLLTEGVNLAAAALGAARAGKPGLGLWAPMLKPYFLLATLAMWRALWQAARDPFHWEKTAHGLFAPESSAVLPPPATPPPAPAAHPASAGS